MMMKEFTERTGIEPTNEEYAEIEKDYYEFDGDKNEFCKVWKKEKGMAWIAQQRLEKIEQLNKITAGLMEDIKSRDKQITNLKEQINMIENWKPYEEPHNAKQADYEELESDPSARELSDEEAINLISEEFGFKAERIRIIHEVEKLEISTTTKRTRRVGTYVRKALFDVWDWNYIRFNVRGNTTISYEMVNGELEQFWG